MTQKDLKRASKFLSLVLRHKPESIGLQLDGEGWAATNELLDKFQSAGFPLSFAQLQEVVESNDKKRFSFSADHSKIRANQGHSLPIDLRLKAQSPPEVLFHGTAKANVPAIMKEGLQKQQRHHVHLSADKITAKGVGARYGKPVVLVVKAAEMHRLGMKFYLSENAVWLTDHVPPGFIEAGFEAR